MISIQRNAYFMSPKNHALHIQIGYTCFCIGQGFGMDMRRSPRHSEAIVPYVHLDLFAPRQTPDGYKRKGFWLRIGKRRFGGSRFSG